MNKAFTWTLTELCLGPINKTECTTVKKAANPSPQQVDFKVSLPWINHRTEKSVSSQSDGYIEAELL